MTRDTDPTPPHGIPRPSLSPLDEARAYLMDEMANAFTLYPAEQVPAVHAPMRTLADLLDIAEAFPALWHAGEADTLEGIADQLARMAGARLCPSCGEMRHPDDFGSWVRPVCDWCREDEPDHVTPSGWERVKDAPAHPFGGAADR